MYPSSASVPVVYVANGMAFPDALSAAPAAGIQGGPLLLTLQDRLPDGVAAEIVRLHPARIVVVGGPASVGPAVFNDLALLAPSIERLGGTDRFEASRNIVRSAFADQSPTIAYLATGANFPDALSASAVGGLIGAPVILVNGALPSLDVATMDLLADLGITKVKIAGGPASVSTGIESSLVAVYGAGQVVRLSGADRYQASTNIALDAFPGTVPEVLIATGVNFPDALAGAPYAASKGSPLIVVPGTSGCVPKDTMAALDLMDTVATTLIGGPASLPISLEWLAECMW